MPGCSGIRGCTHPEACNFNIDAQLNDGSCWYANNCEDCDGNCLPECPPDDCGTCGGNNTCCAAEDNYPDCNGDCNGSGQKLIYVAFGQPVISNGGTTATAR